MITTAAPSAKVASRWGDWHFGTDFARAIQRLGYEVHVQTLDHADSVASRCYDIHIVLRGLAPVRRTPGQRQMIWIISQPETITTEEIDEADLVYVASERFAEDAPSAHRDTGRGAPPGDGSPPVPARPRRPAARARRRVRRQGAHGVRPVVADALAGGIRPALYGTGWESYVDPTLVVAQYVPNEILPAVYASAGVVLNDHTTTMRRHGFVSNRIFDALACGAPVISDALPEVAHVFNGSVDTYADADELRMLVERALGDPARARQRASFGRDRVLAAHTFDHRARTVVDAIEHHQLFIPSPPPR